MNVKLSAIHAYLGFAGLPGCKVKLLRMQHKAFLKESRELSEPEYRRLLGAAQSSANERLQFLMFAIRSTGIRVSELKCITLEAVRARRAGRPAQGIPA